MSILLDALRKSEQQQRLGGVPDIHSADGAVPAPAAGQRRLWIAGLALVLLLLFGAVLAWRLGLLTGDDAPGGGVSDSAVSNTAASDTGAAASSSAFTPAGPAQAPPAAAQASTARNDLQQASESDASSGRETPQSPVESLSGARPFQPAARQAADAGARNGRAAAGRSAAPVQDRPDPIVDRGQSALALIAGESQPAFGDEARPEPAPAEPPPARSPNTPAPAQSATASEANGLISYWQLPEFTRKQLPPFKINVLVFDEDPGRRFVLMDGQRLQIGDTPLKSLRVLNIERDRVVFRYGVYRFYVRQGS